MPARHKVVSLEQLLQLRARVKAEGKTVVHCHGCFDIVHPGHIHHLQHARSLGDLLVVSVSADTHVQKGVDRPLIPDDLRAQSLAALECVDFVYLNPDPTAVDLIEQFRPDLYVKGKEYEQNFDPRFVAERDTVTRHGGRVIFSSGDVVYSSTALIGQMRLGEQFAEEKLQRFCRRFALSSAGLQNLTHRFRGQRVLVIGDYILDRYHFCDAHGIAGEAPVMALRELEIRDFDGGAAVVAMHLASLGAMPTLITSFADDDASRQAALRLVAAGVDVCDAPFRRNTVQKNRYLADDSKLFKVDSGTVQSLDSQQEDIVSKVIIEAASDASAVIFADFGYGLITGGLLERIMQPLRATVPIISADVSGRQSNLLRFRGIDLLCPTEREVRETLHDFTSGLGAVVANLLNATDARQAIITLGKQGLVTFDWPNCHDRSPEDRLQSEYIPALSTRSLDPLGCGDALLAVATLALASGASLQAAAFLGSLAAAVEVQSVGNVPVTLESLLGMIVDRELALTETRLAS